MLQHQNTTHCVLLQVGKQDIMDDETSAAWTIVGDGITRATKALHALGDTVRLTSAFVADFEALVAKLCEDIEDSDDESDFKPLPLQRASRRLAPHESAAHRQASQAVPLRNARGIPYLRRR